MKYVVCVGVLLLLAACSGGREVNTQQWQQELEQVNRLRVETEVGFGNFIIQALEEHGEDSLIQTKVETNESKWLVDPVYELQGRLGSFTWRQPDGGGWVWQNERVNLWEMWLPTGTPTELQIQSYEADVQVQTEAWLGQEVEAFNAAGDTTVVLDQGAPILESILLQSESGMLESKLLGQFPRLSQLMVVNSDGGIRFELSGDYQDLQSLQFFQHGEEANEPLQVKLDGRVTGRPVVEIESVGGDITLELGKDISSQMDVRVVSQQGSIRLRVHPELPVSISTENSLTTIDPQGFQTQDNRFLNDAALQTDGVLLDITMESAEGELVLRESSER